VSGARLDDRARAVVRQVAGMALQYPDEELLALLPQLQGAAATLPASVGGPLAGLLDHLAHTPPTELAAGYVATFDLQRRCALHLTYYAYGDTRRRGVALLRFSQVYRRAGFVLDAAELPDHLGVVLEFAATVDAAAGERLLRDHRAGLELLRLALTDAGSPYAAAVAAVCATLPPLQGDERAAVARLAAEGPPGEEVGLDPFTPLQTVSSPRRSMVGEPR
jgi:nitrate reductase molybdenum cofactor assembly chaperone NarJ/NarW